MAVWICFLCIPDCLKQPRIEYSFYRFLHPMICGTISGISPHCVPAPIELVGGAFTKRAAHTLQLLSVNISPSLPQPPAFLPRLSNTLALVLEFHPSNSSSSRSRLWWLSSHSGAEPFINLHLIFCLFVCLWTPYQKLESVVNNLHGCYHSYRCRQVVTNYSGKAKSMQKS